MLDPYDPFCVHGLWPLVADPSSAGGLRFADMGRDAASDCVASPEALPEAAVEVRTFATPEARDAWCAAVAEFGGNAVHASALDRTEILAALLVRFDRERPSGATVDDCVRLVGTVPGFAAYARSNARVAMRAEARDRAWRTAWAVEADAVSRIEGLRIDAMGGDTTPERLVVDRRGGGLVAAVWVEPVPGGRRLTARIGQTDGLDIRESDLSRALRAAVADLGYEVDAHGDPSKVVTVADEKAIRGLLDDMAEVARLRRSMLETSARRSLLRDAAEGRPGTILRRLADGFPVAKSPASSTYCYQVNPVSGAGVDVDGYAMERLWKAGAVRPAWWTDRVARTGDGNPFDAFGSSLWVASPLGLALASGKADIHELADRVPASKAEALAILDGDATPPSFAEALASVVPRNPWTPSYPERAPAPLPEGKRPPKRARDLALLAGWQVHGFVGVHATA